MAIKAGTVIVVTHPDALLPLLLSLKQDFSGCVVLRLK